ncbi:Orotate phosphoribosyltransferase [Rickettsiales bacterium Ac37b]|nr:Orotate phosphoribosyltransferase [Rickettsiales bacterium Ac37b]
MDQQAIIKEFEDAQAILRGHFILSSGLHSDTYLQCARVLMNASRAERLCNALAKKIVNSLSNINFDIIVSPAMGGVIVGYEMGRQLNIPSVFCERANGVFALRRGFNIPNNANVLIVEDVLTTGKSSKEAFTCVEENGGKVVAIASLIDRSNAPLNLEVPFISLLRIEAKTYAEETLPAHLKNMEATKPGSRNLA